MDFNSAAVKDCVFLNTDALTLQRQSELYHVLLSFEDAQGSKKKIFHYRDMGKVLPLLKNNNNLIDLSINNLSSDKIAKCFFKMLLEKNKLSYRDDRIFSQKSFKSFIFNYTSLDSLDKCINALSSLGSSDVLLTPDFSVRIRRPLSSFA